MLADVFIGGPVDLSFGSTADPRGIGFRRSASVLRGCVWLFFALDKHTLCQNAAGGVPASNSLSHVRRLPCVMRHSVPSSCQSVPSRHDFFLPVPIFYLFSTFLLFPLRFPLFARLIVRNMLRHHSVPPATQGANHENEPIQNALGAGAGPCPACRSPVHSIRAIRGVRRRTERGEFLPRVPGVRESLHAAPGRRWPDGRKGPSGLSYLHSGRNQASFL